MNTRALVICLPAFALSGCLTLPQIEERVNQAQSDEVSYRIPVLTCTKSKEAHGQMIAAKNALGPMTGATTEIGKILTASLGHPDKLLSPNVEVTHISRENLSRELRAIQLLAQETTSTKASKDMGVFERYFEAYFRKGRFINAGLSIDDAKKRIKQDLRNGLNIGDDTSLPADQEKILDEASAAFVKLVCPTAPCNLLKADEDAAFVNRAGQKFGFPVVTFVVKPGSARGYELTKLDEVQVVGDLTRVFWEATFDAASEGSGLKMPADAKATGCQSKRLNSFDCIDPKNEAGQKGLGSLNLVADRTEGVAGFVAAQVVRGAYFLSLDNEALAKLFQTSISVSARKAAELVVTANQLCDDKGAASPHRTVSFKLVK
jgi:hypothetical protein